jgi:hypothetical protein
MRAFLVKVYPYLSKKKRFWKMGKNKEIKVAKKRQMPKNRKKGLVAVGSKNKKIQ